MEGIACGVGVAPSRPLAAALLGKHAEGGVGAAETPESGATRAGDRLFRRFLLCLRRRRCRDTRSENRDIVMKTR